MPKTQHQVAQGDSDIFGREGSIGPKPSPEFEPIPKPGEKVEKEGGEGKLPKDVMDNAMRAMAQGTGYTKDAKTEPLSASDGGRAPAARAPVDRAPDGPIAPKADSPTPATPAAQKPPEGKAPADKPPAEKPPEEPSVGGHDDAGPRWRIPMDTVFGRTPRSDLERYLKTIAATLQTQEGLTADKAIDLIDAVVTQMTQAGLLPPMPADPGDDDIDRWMDAAMEKSVASVILDRA